MARLFLPRRNPLAHLFDRGFLSIDNVAGELFPLGSGKPPL
ncbi:MAG: hypothetical protein ABIO91_05395 [Pyrinomonadaceae bacterium]